MSWEFQIGTEYFTGPVDKVVEELDGHEEALIDIPNTLENQELVATDQDVIITLGGETVFTGRLTGATFHEDKLRCIIYNKCFEQMDRNIFTGTYDAVAANTILAAICTAAGVTAGTCPTTALSLRFVKASCLDAAIYLAYCLNKDFWSSDLTFNIDTASGKGSDQGSISVLAVGYRAIDRSKLRNKVFVRGFDKNGNPIEGSAQDGAGDRPIAFFERQATDIATLNGIAAKKLADLKQEVSGSKVTTTIAECASFHSGDSVTLSDQLRKLEGSYRIFKITKKTAYVELDLDRISASPSDLLKGRFKDLESLGIYPTPDLDSPPGPPATPANVLATGQPHNVLLTWDANTEADLDRYIVYRGLSADPTTVYAEVDSTIFVDDDVAYGTTYHYRVKARDRVGNLSAYSTCQDAGPVQADLAVDITGDLDDVPDGDLWKRLALGYWQSGGKPYTQELAQIIDGLFTADTAGRAKFAASLIVADLIAAGAIISTKIAAGAVTSAKITSGQIIGKDFRTATNVGEVGGPAGIRLTASEIAGYSGGTTKQFYVLASDGKLYAAGGGVILDSSGVTIKGQWLTLKDSGDVVRGYLYGVYGPPNSLYLQSEQLLSLWAKGDMNVMVDGTELWFNVTGNIVRPRYDDDLYFGTPSYRWKEVRAVDLYGTAHYADVYFQEVTCPLCDKQFKPGEAIQLLVINVTDETRTIPKHARCPTKLGRFMNWVSHGLRI